MRCCGLCWGGENSFCDSCLAGDKCSFVTCFCGDYWCSCEKYWYVRCSCEECLCGRYFYGKCLCEKCFHSNVEVHLLLSASQLCKGRSRCSDTHCITVYGTDIVGVYLVILSHAWWSWLEMSLQTEHEDAREEHTSMSVFESRARPLQKDLE